MLASRIRLVIKYIVIIVITCSLDFSKPEYQWDMDILDIMDSMAAEAYESMCLHVDFSAETEETVRKCFHFHPIIHQRD